MAHVTDLGFTMDELEQAIANGDIRSQVHPEIPHLRIYNYAEDVQFKNKWNKITLQCRGLILNTDTGEVVARPWKKFFNFGQRDNEIDSQGPVEVTDKLDGSLGILYHDGTKWAIATRGSFASEQSIHATKLLNEKYPDIAHRATLAHQCTYLFEIISPWNRIVVDYDGMDDLVLLGGVDNTRGYYMGPQEASGLLGWSGPAAEVFQAKNFVSALSLPDRKGKEGYIIRSGNKIVKLKQANYLIAHRVVTNLSPKFVWSMLGDGKTVDDICAGIPDEFYDYVKDIADELNMQASAIRVDVSLEFRSAEVEVWENADGITATRKMWADAIKKRKNVGLLFSILDGKDITEQIWNMVKPRGDIKSLVKDDV